MSRGVVAASIGAGIVAVYVGASWFCGYAVNNSFESWQQKNQARLPPFIKVEHQYTPGLFHSSHLTIIHVDPSVLQKFWPAQAQKTVAQVAPESDATTSAATPAESESNLQSAPQPFVITVRHDVSHGPLPDFKSLGLARVQTHLVLSDDARKELSKVIGNQEPLSIVTQLKLSGGGVTDITSPAFDVTEDDKKIAWRGVQGRFDFTRHSDALKGVLKAPGLTVSSDKGQFAVGELVMQFDLTRIVDQIYAGTTTLTADGIDGTYGDEAGVLRPVKMEKLQYSGVVAQSGDYFDMSAKMDLGRLDVKDIVLSDLAYHITVKHLHTPTYTTMMRKVQSLYWDGHNPAAQADMKNAFQEFLPTLLEHNPELIIDRIAVTLPEGTASLSASVKLPGFTREDMNGMHALGKLEAAADISIAQALIEKDWSANETQDAGAASSAATRMNGLRTQAAKMEEQGFIVKCDGNYESHVEFKQGHLTVNGKMLR